MSWIYADEREKSGQIISYLIKLGVVPVIKKLDMGDFIISDRIVIERKTVNDLVNSYLDGRLMEQIRRLKENFEHVILLVEGTPSALKQRDLPRGFYWHILAKIIGVSVNVISISTPLQCAMFIYALVELERGEDRFPLLRRGKRSLTPEESRILILESFPGIGEKTASKLLSHFGTLRRVMMSSQEELVPLLGPRRASEFINLLDKKDEKSTKKPTTLDLLQDHDI